MRRLFTILFIVGAALCRPAYADVNLSAVSLPDGRDCEIFFYDETGALERVTRNEFDDHSPAVAVGLTGEPHMVWVGSDGEDGEIFYAYRGGGKWSEPVQLTDDSVSDTSPVAVVDSQGRIWIAWAHFDGEDDEIFCMHSDGTGWSVPVQVSKRDSWPDICPVLRVDSAGGVSVSWSGYDGEAYTTYSSFWDGDKWSEEEKREKEERVLKADYQVAIIESKFVGFGDSITYGTRSTQGGGYGPFLEEKLRTIYPGAVVVLRGEGGGTTSDGVDRIDSVLEEEDGEYMLILMGTNDIQAAISRETILFNLKEMVRKTIEHGSIPVLGTLPPRRDLETWNKWTERLNREQIRPFVRRERILLADHWKFFYEEPDWQALIGHKDEHPNDAGYAVMADCWFVALEEDLPPSGLTATVEGEMVRLSWEENSETGVEGYNIYRRLPFQSGYEKLNDVVVTETTYYDEELNYPYYYYAVTVVDRCGNESDCSSEAGIGLSSGDGGDCFIATACYGSPLACEVRILSEFRDEHLLRNSVGRTFVRWYYRVSPPLAGFIAKHPVVKLIVRAQIGSFVKVANFVGMTNCCPN